MAFQGNAFQHDAFQTGVEAGAPPSRGWFASAVSTLPPASKAMVAHGGLRPVFADLNGVASVQTCFLSWVPKSYAYEAPRRLSEPPAPPDPTPEYNWRGASVTSTLPPRTYAAVAQIVEPIERFVEKAWPPTVASSLLPPKGEARARVPAHPYEFFYARAWAATATATLPPRSRSAVAQIVTLVETFYPRAWAARAESVLARTTQARYVWGGWTRFADLVGVASFTDVASRLPARTSTYVQWYRLPPEPDPTHGWFVRATSNLAQRTAAGILPPTPQAFVEPPPAHDWSASAQTQAPAVNWLLTLRVPQFFENPPPDQDWSPVLAQTRVPAVGFATMFWAPVRPVAVPLGATRRPLLRFGGSATQFSTYFPGKPPRFR